MPSGAALHASFFLVIRKKKRERVVTYDPPPTGAKVSEPYTDAFRYPVFITPSSPSPSDARVTSVAVSRGGRSVFVPVAPRDRERLSIVSANGRRAGILMGPN